MKVFITGIAGFIGFHTANKFLDMGWEVQGLDNFNDYYDPKLKEARAQKLSALDVNIVRCDLSEIDTLSLLDYKPDLVIHLAASAGIRHSLANPQESIQNNIVNTQTLINHCEKHSISNIIYASTSAVMNGNPLPWNEHDKCGVQVSPYGYTKLANESQFDVSRIPHAVGLRFFTVYGPWGRPDMALFDFTNKIINNQPITVYNNGDMKRDFTYVKDIVKGIWIVANNMTERDIYCIGNGETVDLMDFISEIERNIGNGKAEYDFQPMHPADAKETWSDTSKLKKLGYNSSTDVPEGVTMFVRWYKEYYHV
jgi:UDP-glucuronate 4-epimerase